MSTTPPARPSWLPPAKPGTVGSTNSWNSAIASDKTSRGIVHPDQKMIPEFADEFEAVPRPSFAESKTRLLCTNQNLNYIPSVLPMPVTLPMQAFYDDMAKRQWNKARPSALPGVAPAFLRVGQAIGARRDMIGNQVADRSRPAMPGGIATDWKAIPELQRVNAYAFRGDKREPRLIKATDGFHPPASRTDKAYVELIARNFTTYMKTRYNQDVSPRDVVDYINGKGLSGRVFTEYEIWRMILKGEEMHLGRMLANEFLKGYISTSRDITVASRFAGGGSQDGVGGGRRGVYALHTEGGFLMPKWKTHVHATMSEAEIAHPGRLPWSKVMAFRLFTMIDGNMEDYRTFKSHDIHRTQQVVFVRKGFREKDPTGCREVVLALGAFD